MPKMRYFTVNEISEKWNISSRRVCALCKNGRIPGAVKRSKVWMIPSDAKKPEDARTSDSSYSLNPVVLLFSPDYEKDKGNIALSKKEKQICEIQKKYYSGHMEDAYYDLNIILEAEKNPEYMFLLEFLKFLFAANLGKREDFYNAQRELALIKQNTSIPGYITEVFDFLSGATTSIGSEFFDGEAYQEIMPLVSLVSMKRGLNELIRNGVRTNVTHFELICAELENKDYPLICAYSHIFMAVYLNAVGDKQSFDYHMDKALQILLPRGWYLPLAEYSLTVDFYFIKDLDPKAYRIIEMLSGRILKNYVGVGIFDSLIENPRRNKGMYIQIGLKIVQGKSNEDISRELGMSLYKVKQYINDLSDAAGSSSKRDITKYVLRNFVL